MKIYLYSNSLNHATFKLLISLNWIGWHDGWEFYDIAQLKDAVEGVSGYSPRKIDEMLPTRERRVVLVEGNLYNLSRFGKSDDGLTFVFSIKGYEKNFDLIKSAIKAVEFFALGDQSCRKNDCMFASSFLLNSSVICPECQLELLKRNCLSSVVRLITIENLEKQHFSFYYYHNSHIGKAIKELGIASRLPAIQVELTNLIIDSIALPGSSIRNWLATASYSITQEKNNIKNRYKSFGPKRGESPPFLIASRRWNSWTPNQPVKEDSRVLHFKTGGGYFFSDGKTNIAIDPGYGYLDMLFRHGITVMDIDCVIITHDHPDHLAEAQNILGLRFNYADQCKELEFYCNPSSFYILSGFTKYYGSLLKHCQSKPLFPGTEIYVGEIAVATIGMYHTEIYDHLGKHRKDVDEFAGGPSKALGLKFTFKDSGQQKATFVIPGDTSFPKEPQECERLLKFYGNPDVAAIHLGSLEEKWCDTSSPASNIEYGKNKHLGINGVIHFLQLLKPKFAIITEFGEELDANDMRFSVIELINQALSAVDIKILPSDINLFVAFYQGIPHCRCECTHFVPYQYINYQSRDPNIKYDFSSGCQSGLCHVLTSKIFPKWATPTTEFSYKSIKNKNSALKRSRA